MYANLNFWLKIKICYELPISVNAIAGRRIAADLDVRFTGLMSIEQWNRVRETVPRLGHFNY